MPESPNTILKQIKLLNPEEAVSVGKENELHQLARDRVSQILVRKLPDTPLAPKFDKLKNYAVCLVVQKGQIYKVYLD